MIVRFLCFVVLCCSACTPYHLTQNYIEPARIQPPNPQSSSSRYNSDGSVVFYNRTNPAPRIERTFSDDISDQINENFSFDPYDYASTVVRGATNNIIQDQMDGLTPYAGRFGSELIRTPINNSIGRILSSQ